MPDPGDGGVETSRWRPEAVGAARRRRGAGRVGERRREEGARGALSALGALVTRRELPDQHPAMEAVADLVPGAGRELAQVLARDRVEDVQGALTGPRALHDPVREEREARDQDAAPPDLDRALALGDLVLELVELPAQDLGVGEVAELAAQPPAAHRRRFSGRPPARRS